MKTLRKTSSRIPEKDCISCSEAARLIGVSREYIRQLVDLGRIPTRTFAGVSFVSRKDAKRIQSKRRARLAQA